MSRLVLTLSLKEQIRIGDDVVLRFYHDARKNMRVSIEAPQEVQIKREPLESSAAKVMRRD